MIRSICAVILVGACGASLPAADGGPPVRFTPRAGAAHIFMHANRASAAVYGRHIFLGAEGVCFETRAPIAQLWTGVALSNVDPRLVARVLPPAMKFRIVHAAPDRWEIHGAEARTWLTKHLRLVEEARRNFVDLAEIHYEVRTDFAWYAMATPALEAALAEREELRLVGWRWSEVDRADKAFTQEVGDPLANYDAGWVAIRDRELLPPGPCPITGESRPLVP